MNKKQKIALTLNIVIFLLSVVGSIFCFGEIYIMYTKPIEHGFKLFKFFTVQSNVLAGITSFIYLIFLLRENKTKNKVPASVHIFRYIATIDLVITFLVVALFLGFVTDEGYLSMYYNANFFYHFAVPVLNLISFVWFESKPKFELKDTLWGITHLLLYAIFYLSIVVFHMENGKVDLYYDWYGFAQMGLAYSYICGIIVMGLGYLTAYVLYKVTRKSKY